MVAFDPGGRILDANQNAAKLFKYRPKDLLSVNMKDILPAEVWADLAKNKSYLAEKFENEITDNKGKVIPVAIHIKSLKQVSVA